MINVLIIALIAVLLILDVFYLISTKKKAKAQGIKSGCFGCDSYKNQTCSHQCMAATINFLKEKETTKGKIK